jgi:N-acyl-D-amino-acid deacylase
MLARLRDPATRSRIRDELRKDLSSGIAGRTADTTMFDHTAHEPHRKFQGKTIDQVAVEMGVEPAEALLELIDKADGSTRAIYFGMRESDVRFALTRPWTTIGSDGTAIAPDGILAWAHPHPRWYGTFPGVLGRYVRQEKAMLLVEAVRKMTSLPASRLGLDDRGTLAVGEKADIVLFDPETIIDRSDFANPHQLSVGVQWLLVNGTVVLANGHHTNARPGRVLRNRVRVGARNRGCELMVAP